MFKVVTGRKPTGMNARVLRLECAHILTEDMLMLVLMYGNETLVQRVSAVHMDNLRGLLGISRLDRVPNARIREFSGVR